MSFEFAYRFKQDAPRSRFQDLDDVVLTATVLDDNRRVVPAGTEGTIVSVYRDGEAYMVELSEPEGALISVAPEEIQLIEGVPL